jgi:Fe(3+) dicitrate transport protein
MTDRSRTAPAPRRALYAAVAVGATLAPARAWADPPDAAAAPAPPPRPHPPRRQPEAPAPAATPEAPPPAETREPDAEVVPVRRRRPAPPPAPAAHHDEEGSATVVGSASRALEQTPGSATLLRREDLRMLAPIHGGDALRTVPGVNVTAEDGMGLRLNIGIRGLDPNRSRKVLILEDGLPLSLNPYGSPELYYTPPIERMERVEVVRGSGQILWGPQTVGGVINYITRDPPRQPSAGFDLRYGDYGYFLAHARAGATHGAVGWSVDVIHRRFDGPRRMDMAITDVTSRLRLQISPRSVLRVKFNLFDESSRTTYVGPSTPQFAADPAFNPAIHDQFLVRRYALSVVHQTRFTDNLTLQTSLYGYTTDRAWRRQDFEREDTGADYERVCDDTGRCGPQGDPTVSPNNRRGSLFFRQESAIRNRHFEVMGFEPRLTWRWGDVRGVHGELIATARYLRETAHEQVLITAFPTARSGDPQDEERRTGNAMAAAVQNRITLGRRWHITPGLRVENFWQQRRILRVPVTDSMGVRRGSDVDVAGAAFSWALIPGLGVSVDVARPVTLYTGIHRGYAPPRTSDAVSNTGASLNLDPELSWNAEFGTRLRLGRWLHTDVAVFHMEFQNQIIPPSLAGGASGGSFNTGHSRHTGVEATATFDLATRLGSRTLAVPLIVNYTWLPVADFVGGLFGGNRLPYAAEHLVNAQLRVVHRVGFAGQVTVNYVAAQFADKENTVFPSTDGLVGEIPGYLTLDARVAYTHRRSGLTFSLTGRNLTNQVYIANRAPQGIQAAGWRQVFAGIEWNWPRS